MRARWALINSKINFIWREVDLKKKPIELIDVSPKATVPVLITPKGEIIDESIEIMKWSLLQIDHNNILLEDCSLEQKKIQTLLHENDYIFKFNPSCN